MTWRPHSPGVGGSISLRTDSTNPFHSLYMGWGGSSKGTSSHWLSLPTRTYFSPVSQKRSEPLAQITWHSWIGPPLAYPTATATPAVPFLYRMKAVAESSAAW